MSVNKWIFDGLYVTINPIRFLNGLIEVTSQYQEGNIENLGIRKNINFLGVDTFFEYNNHPYNTIEQVIAAGYNTKEKNVFYPTYQIRAFFAFLLHPHFHKPLIENLAEVQGISLEWLVLGSAYHEKYNGYTFRFEKQFHKKKFGFREYLSVGIMLKDTVLLKNTVGSNHPKKRNFINQVCLENKTVNELYG